MHTHIYEKLRDYYHCHPIGYPKTGSGVELQLLKKLFSPEEICPMDALSLADEKATINLERCLGCGLCASECPTEAISLTPKSKRTTPAANFTELMKVIATQKGRSYF
jgi:NAD-dependent dihydropyrimidine dehydrogenase PreA subunit